MKKRMMVALAVSSLVVVTGCGKKSSVDDSVVDSIENGVAAIGGSSDEQSGDVAALTRGQKFALELENIVLPKAWATACSGRAVSAACSTMTKTATYSGCTLGASPYVANG